MLRATWSMRSSPSFVMIYLTDTVGLNPGIVGTLIAVSKLFDGLTDIFLAR